MYLKRSVASESKLKVKQHEARVHVKSIINPDKLHISSGDKSNDIKEDNDNKASGCLNCQVESSLKRRQINILLHFYLFFIKKYIYRRTTVNMNSQSSSLLKGTFYEISLFYISLLKIRKTLVAKKIRKSSSSNF